MKIFIIFIITVVTTFASVQQVIDTNKGSLQIVLFYTKWCPACKRSVELLENTQKQFITIKVVTVNVDRSNDKKELIKSLPEIFINIEADREEAKNYGLKNTIPLILIYDKYGVVIKRFYTTPSKTYFENLIKRFLEGYLENGTLPIEQRVDLWKQERK